MRDWGTVPAFTPLERYPTMVEMFWPHAMNMSTPAFTHWFMPSWFESPSWKQALKSETSSRALTARKSVAAGS